MKFNKIKIINSTLFTFESLSILKASSSCIIIKALISSIYFDQFELTNITSILNNNGLSIVADLIIFNNGNFTNANMEGVSNKFL